LGHNRLTGVNLWANDLSNELRKKGHQVHFHISPDKDNEMRYIKGYAAFYEKADNHIFDKDDLVGLDCYDVIILNYNIHEDMIKNVKCPVIFVSHGTMDEWYYPKYKHQYHIGVSDRTKEDLECDEVVYNGVNTSKFFPYTGINVNPQSALYLYRGFMSPELNVATQRLGIELHHGNVMPNVDEMINTVDFVIGYGRSVYEGMSSGRPVLIYGDNGCDGWVNEWNFKELLRGNCSGWNTECEYDVDGLVDVIRKYDFSQGKINRRLIKENLSLEVMGDTFERIIIGVVNNYDERYDTDKFRQAKNNMALC
jgi:glycosyltransferase involved in cell wall biosynthesis